jgi:hypothetical protein
MLPFSRETVKQYLQKIIRDGLSGCRIQRRADTPQGHFLKTDDIGRSCGDLVGDRIDTLGRVTDPYTSKNLPDYGR